MTSANQSQIDRLAKEIATLRQAEARETSKEAVILAKITRLIEAVTRTSNSSLLQSKLKEKDRSYKELSSVRRKLADVSRKLADKSKILRSCQEKQAREDERERKKIADEQQRQIRERERHEQRITREVLQRANFSRMQTPDVGTPKFYDFFISHANEDKDGFVRGLAEALRNEGAKVWYDEFTLKVGDSLRREIERGLVNSRFGIVVLSKNFFNKEWAQKELDGLSILESDGSTHILPIWHEISKDEVASHSPMLADKIALNTSINSTAQIATELCKLIQ